MLPDNLNLPLTIVLTGPESSGKTTLALDLANALETNLVPEFSRYYLQYLGRKYGFNDLETIYSGQKIWHAWHLKNCKGKVLICDTDWTVLHVWEQYRYGTAQLTQHEKPLPNTYYFLCSPDMPWAPDPLRENPMDRDALFGQYLHLISEIKANFSILHGNPSQRLQTALAIIQDLC